MKHMLGSLPMLLTIGVTVLGSADAAFAQSACELQKLLASDGESLDNFGISVAMDGDTAVVGSPRHCENGDSPGAAYFGFRPTTTCVRGEIGTGSCSIDTNARRTRLR